MMLHARICYTVACVGENALANMDNLQTVYYESSKSQYEEVYNSHYPS